MTSLVNICLKMLAFTFLFVSVSVFAQVPTPILFKAQSPSGQVSYLFGTFHFGIGLNEFPDYLRKAQDQTQVHYAEDNMIEVASLFKLVRTKPHDAVEKLRQKFHASKNQVSFTPQEIDELVALGFPREFAYELKDENCFFLFYRKQFFTEPFHSLEAELEERTVSAGKPVIELDSKDLSQEAYKNEQQSTCRVRDYLKNSSALAVSDKEVEEFINWYRNLSPELALLMPDNSDDTVTIRTEGWMKTLLPIMQEKPVFISVGLAHLIGPKGLIKLLQVQGFTVVPFYPY